MQLYAGLDLHSRSTYIGILDQNLIRVFKKRLPNDLKRILTVLEPFREQLKGLVVESTYNWYWLVDGLMDAGYARLQQKPIHSRQRTCAAPLREFVFLQTANPNFILTYIK